MDTNSACPMCGPLPDTYLAQTAYRLQKLGFSFSRDLWRCPDCGALFDWEDIPQYYGSGNLDEERLTRLNESQSALIRTLLDLDLGERTAAEVLDHVFREVPEDLAREILRHQAITRRDDFAPFVEPLVGRMVHGGGIDLADVISSYCSYDTASLRQIVAWLEAAEQPLKPGARFLLNRCKERLPKPAPDSSHNS